MQSCLVETFIVWSQPPFYQNILNPNLKNLKHLKSEKYLYLFEPKHGKCPNIDEYFGYFPNIDEYFGYFPVHLFKICGPFYIEYFMSHILTYLFMATNGKKSLFLGLPFLNSSKRKIENLKSLKFVWAYLLIQ